MGNQSSIPHLIDVDTAKNKQYAKVNNQIRTYLWPWWSSDQVKAEMKNGSKRSFDESLTDVEKKKDVKRVFAPSNNGEDVNLFIEWVTEKAPKATQKEVMSIRSEAKMIDFVWKKGLVKMGKGKLYTLKY